MRNPILIACTVAVFAACTPKAEEPAPAPAAPASAPAAAPAPPAPDLATPAPTGPAPPAGSTPATPNTSLSSTPAPAAPALQTATKEELATGAEVYGRICIICHAPDGKGVPDKAPALKEKDVALIKTKVTRGKIKDDDKMPPWGAAMSPEELDDVSKYAASLVP